MGAFQNEEKKRPILLAYLGKIQENSENIPYSVAEDLPDKCLLSECSVEEPDAGNLQVRFCEGL